MKLLGKRSGQPLLMLLVAVVLTALLGVLGYLQYRWLGRVSERERQLMQADLERTVDDIRFDVDCEINRLRFLFMNVFEGGSGPPETEAISNAVERWKMEAEWPQLAGEILLRRQHVISGVLESEFFSQPPNSPYVTWKRWNQDARTWEPGEWRPQDDDGTALHIDPAGSSKGGAGFAPYSSLFPDVHDEGVGRFSSAEPEFNVDQVVIHLNVAYLKSQLLPHVIRKHFGRSLPDYRVEVIDPIVPAGRQTIYVSEPAAPGPALNLSRPDVSNDILTVRPADFAFLLGLSYQGDKVSRKRAFGRWTITATHRSGSLDAAAVESRRRNLALAFGILALLAASMVITLVSERRARLLARHQRMAPSEARTEPSQPLNSS